MTTTLFIGLGHMGAPMATLHAAAFPTAVFDLSDEAVARVVADSEATAFDDLAAPLDAMGTVVLMLPSSRHVEDVLTGGGGLLARLPSGSLIIDMGSSEPMSTRRLAAQAAEFGVDYVDAPVSGGVAKARTGELSILVGGDTDVVARAMPHLEALGTTIISVGGAGAGDAAKAINNLVSATNVAVACEALSIAKGFGIPPEVMTEVLNSATGRSQASEVKLPDHIIPGSFSSGFSFDLMLKDMAIAGDLAESLDTPVTAQAFASLTQGRGRLGEAPDHTEIGRLYGFDLAIEHPSGCDTIPVERPGGTHEAEDHLVHHCERNRQ